MLHGSLAPRKRGEGQGEGLRLFQEIANDSRIPAFQTCWRRSAPELRTPLPDPLPARAGRGNLSSHPYSSPSCA